MARSTWDGSREPEVQAEPDDDGQRPGHDRPPREADPDHGAVHQPRGPEGRPEHAPLSGEGQGPRVDQQAVSSGIVSGHGGQHRYRAILQRAGADVRLELVEEDVVAGSGFVDAREVVDPAHPFPRVLNKALCIASLLEVNGQTMLGVVTVPRVLPRILRLPDQNGRRVKSTNGVG